MIQIIIIAESIWKYKMKNTIAICLSFCCLQFFYAQSPNQELNNIFQRIENAMDSDSTFNIENVLAECMTAAQVIKDENSTQGFTLFFLKGRALYKDGQYKEVVPELAKAISIAKELNDKDYEQILHAYHLLGDSERRKRNYKIAIEKINEGIKFTQPHISFDNIHLGHAYLVLLKTERRAGNFKDAIIQGKKGVSILESNPDTPPSAIAAFYNNLGIAYKQMGDFNNGVIQYEKALAINKANNFLIESTADNYYNLGNIALSLGAFNKAGTYYTKAIEVYEATTQNSNSISSSLIGMGIVYRNQGDYQRALEYYKRGLDLKIKYEDYPPNLGTAYMNVAGCYRYLKEFEKAEQYAEKAIEIYQGFYAKKHSKIGRAFAHLGSIEDEKGNRQKAILHFDAAIENFEASSPNHPYVSSIIASKAKVYRKENNFEKSLATIDKALDLIKNNSWNRPEIYFWKISKAEMFLQQNKVQEAIAIVDSSLNNLKFDENSFVSIIDEGFYLATVDLLKVKAGAYKSLYNNERNLTYLEKSVYQYQLAIKVLFELRENYQSEGSRQFILERNFDVIANTIDILKEIYDETNDKKYLEEAFQIAEKTKGLILMEAFEKNRQKAMANLDQPILERDQLLRGNFDLYEKLLYREELQKEPNDSIIKDLNQKRFESKEIYFAFQDSLKTFIASQSSERNPIPSLVEISQQLASTNAASIEYFIADSSLYIFTFVENQHHFDRVDLPFDFKDQLLTYCENLAYPSRPVDEKIGAFISNHLLEKSFQHFSKNSNLQKITIIPDSWLGYLPFETLASPDDPSKLLIENYDISYAYATHLMLAQKNNDFRKGTKSIATFAPQYEENNQLIAQVLRSRVGKTLSDLPGAKKEAELIAKLFEGDAFTGQGITESQFRNLASDYKLLHLSMHAEMDDVNPMYSHFIFNTANDSLNDGILTAAELYNLPLNADLAVLSACNTGFGTIKKGEGIMSLSRAFRYAGVPATVMSLWKVPDEATSKIMGSFYQFLKEGDTKDSALRRAKLAYLDQAITPEQKHPFYWAGFVATGDMEKIELSSSPHWNLGIGVVVFVGVVFFARAVFDKK